VDHAGIRGGVGSTTSGGHMSRVKLGSKRSGVDFFYKLMEWNVGKTQLAILAVAAHDNGQRERPDSLSKAYPMDYWR